MPEWKACSSRAIISLEERTSMRFKLNRNEGARQ
jgi:hypothetical protein